MARAALFKLAGAAIEMACWDLVGKILGKRCGDLWGGIEREAVEFAGYVFYRYESLEEEGDLSDPQVVAEYALELCETHGFRDVKLKNGVLDPELEIDTVRRMRELGDGRIRNIRIDPNQAWSVETAIRVLRAFDPYDIEFCEDPTWGIEGMSLVRRDTHIPLATNMACVSFEQIPLVVRTRALDIVLGDMHFWGGPTALLQLAKICETFNLGLSLHSDRELGVSTAAIVHLAAAQPMVSHAIDSHLPEQSDDLVTEPWVFRDGCLQVPDGPGLGVELDPDQVERYHRLYLERGDRDEFQDERRREWSPYLPLW
jgi:glucarate dehydratase